MHVCSSTSLFWRGRVGSTARGTAVPLLTLQRHFSTSTKFAHVESRFCGGKQRGKAAACTSTNPCARSACSRSVAVGLRGVDHFHCVPLLGLIGEEGQRYRRRSSEFLSA